MPEFSVIIPFRNRASYLPRTLASVVAQQVRPLQVVLVDNGSTDGSAETCRRFISTHRAAGGDVDFCLTEEPRQGAALARNRGMALATGNWISFFDSDDEMSADFLTDVAAAITAHPGCEVVAAATRMVFGNGKERVRKVYCTTSVIDQILSGMLATQGMVIARDFLLKVGGWCSSLRYWDDWELGIRLLAARPHLVWLTGKAYHRIFQHSDSITGSSFADRWDDMLAAFTAARSGLRWTVNSLDQTCYALALDLRQTIMMAHCRREGGQCEGYLSWKDPHFNRRLKWRLLALYCYVRLGGRGAWRICRWWLTRYERRFHQSSLLDEARRYPNGVLAPWTMLTMSEDFWAQPQVQRHFREQYGLPDGTGQSEG